MATNGEEKLIAMARHIAKTLGHTDNAMADDILQFFSNFDGRLREKLSQNEDPRNAAAEIDQTLKTLDRQISRYITVDQPIWSDSADASAFLDAVEKLAAMIREYTPMAADESVAAYLDRADDLLQQCMFRLEKEFKLLIERRGGGGDVLYAVARGGVGARLDSDNDEAGGDDEVGDLDFPITHSEPENDAVIDALTSGTINDLHEISKTMVSAGYGKECSLAYSTCRRDFLEQSFSQLGFSVSEDSRIALEDDHSHVQIEKWVKAITMAVRVLYPVERRLCNRVFRSSSPTAAANLSFMEVCRISTMKLLNFANEIAMVSRTPERLFEILDVYEAMTDLMPEFEVLFSDRYCLFLRNEAMGVYQRLGESIREIFMKLENLIRLDPLKPVVPGGGLHPVTRYVMNYLRAACSRLTLKQIFCENTVIPMAVDLSSPLSSPLALQMTWLMEVLESNLEAKSKIYRDPALSSIFMINNGRYILNKIKDSELGSLLGDDWIQNQTAKVRQCHVDYQQNSWHKILNTLKFEKFDNNVAAMNLKQQLKLFNSQFYEICRTQSTWVIFDEDLSEELKILVGGALLRAYRNFLDEFHDLQEKQVKFTIEDAEARINNLFQGTAVSRSGRK